MESREKKEVYEKVPINESFNEKEESEVPPYGYGIRHVQAIILFICTAVGYIARAHLGVSIVAMTDAVAHSTNPTCNTSMMVIKTNESEFNRTEILDFNDTEIRFETNVTDIGFNNYEDSIWNVYRTYDWSKSIQDMILGAFFVGYCIAMFPTGMLCQRFGGKIPLQICLLTNAIVTLSIPTVAVWGGWKAVYCCLVIQGASQAGLYPSTHSLLAKWVPVSEKASISSFVYTGTLVGTVIAFQVGGLLASSAAGWPSTFWLIGALCIGAFLMLTIFGAASPALHNTISEDEKNYILGKIDDGLVKKAVKAPWKHIFTSAPLWSTFASHTAAGITFVFLLTQIPSYLHYILGYDVKNSGLLSSLPYIASSIANIGFGVFSDYCINRGYLSTRNARRVCNSIAQWGPAVCLVLLSFTHNSGLAVVLIIMAVGLSAGIHSGWMVNYIDLSPNFSGSLIATGMSGSTIGIALLPVLVSNVVTDVGYVMLTGVVIVGMGKPLPRNAFDLLFFDIVVFKGAKQVYVCIVEALQKVVFLHYFIKSVVDNDVIRVYICRSHLTALVLLGSLLCFCNRHQWNIIMFTMAAMISICNGLFVTFMSSDKQPWDQIEDLEEVEKEMSFNCKKN